MASSPEAKRRRPRVLLRRGEEGAWLAFDAPRKILTAESTDTVPGLLAELEDAVAAGAWVAGYLSYEAAPAFDPAFEAHAPGDDLPLAWWGVFAAPRRVDDLAALDAAGEPGAEDASTPVSLKTVSPKTVSPKMPQWRPAVDREEHGRAVEEVRRRIEAGDTYQVNLTFPMVAGLEEIGPWRLFRRLMGRRPPPHAAFLDLDGGEGTAGRFVLSASPELFFRVGGDDGSHVLTRPMKGTAPRGRYPAEDAARRGDLLSEKNRAENLMIADMMRNDLGRVCRPGSVTVRRLFAVETYPTVHQLVTEVEGRLEEERGAFDVLRALFPSASITGAPKARATAIVRRLERSPRGVYTGSIGCFAPDGSAELSVAIRTVEINGRAARYGTGGGVVWDSKPDDEYAEALAKCRVLDTSAEAFELLETVLWRPRRDGAFPEDFFLLRRHLDRQEASARHFGFAYRRGELEERLRRLGAEWREAGHGRSRVRILASADGGVRVERRDAPCPGRRTYDVRLDDRPVDEGDVFLFHKTSRREVYEAAAARHPDADEVILWNSRGELTEATRANLVVRRDGRWLTPPVSCGLLAGTYRQAAIDRGRVEEAVLRPADLESAEGIFLLNSVRGWMRCRLAGGTAGVPGEGDAGI